MMVDKHMRHVESQKKNSLQDNRLPLYQFIPAVGPLAARRHSGDDTGVTSGISKTYPGGRLHTCPLIRSCRALNAKKKRNFYDETIEKKKRQGKHEPRCTF